MHLLDHGNRVLLATLLWLALAAGVLAASKRSWLPELATALIRTENHGG